MPTSPSADRQPEPRPLRALASLTGRDGWLAALTADAGWLAGSRRVGRCAACRSAVLADEDHVRANGIVVHAGCRAAAPVLRA